MKLWHKDAEIEGFVDGQWTRNYIWQSGIITESWTLDSPPPPPNPPPTPLSSLPGETFVCSSTNVFEATGTKFIKCGIHQVKKLHVAIILQRYWLMNQCITGRCLSAHQVIMLMFDHPCFCPRKFAFAIEFLC